VLSYNDRYVVLDGKSARDYVKVSINSREPSILGRDIILNCRFVSVENSSMEVCSGGLVSNGMLLFLPLRTP